MTHDGSGTYTADDDIVDFILGITFEIWEEGGVDLIHQYYAPDCVVWGLDGITRGAQAVVDATRATLSAFPDRRLIAEHVIWSGSRETEFYSSHRLLSKGTNQGASAYGPATGKEVRMTNIADCVVENGLITREWLIRDTMQFVRQLGVDATRAAIAMRDSRTDDHQAWLDSERTRVAATTPEALPVHVPDPVRDPDAFSHYVVRSLWQGDDAGIAASYAPYCVLHRSPLEQLSGRERISTYFSSLRNAHGRPAFSLDHVAPQPLSTNGVDIAVRWSIAGSHEDDIEGVPASGKPTYILGSTHWRCIAGRIVSESTVFDDLAIMSQVV